MGGRIMTPSESNHGAGHLFLKIARVIFVEPTLSSVVLPAIADFQQELRDAGADRGRRFATRCRACWAFAKLVVILFATSPAGGRASGHLPESAGGGTLVLLVTVLFASTWPFFGWFMAYAVLGGILLAMTMRWWHNRHPSELAVADPQTGTRPEINFSRVPVAGNVGGLIFAVGSMVIVIVGLPEIRWFLLAALVSGVCAAAGLFAWRRAHPAGVQPRNSIVIR